MTQSYRVTVVCNRTKHPRPEGETRESFCSRCFEPVWISKVNAERWVRIEGALPVCEECWKEDAAGARR